MSTRTSLRYFEISPNMALADILKIDGLQRRALALFYSDALDPCNPAAIAAARSVDVPEAGAWGHNVKVRLAELECKKSSRKRWTKRYRTPPELLPNLFMAFDNEAAKLKAAALADVTLSDGGSPSMASSRGVEK
jgi:hypothetical protein